MTYYSAIIRITILLVIVIIVSLRENETISRKRKNTLVAIGVLIIIATICEHVGYILNGKDYLIIFHKILKSTEFSIAPIIPILFSWVLTPNGFSPKKLFFIITILTANSLFEFLSIIIPFTFSVNTDNTYIMGSYYWIYVATYILGIIYLIIELCSFAKRFQSRNVLTLIAMIVFVMHGFLIRLCNYQISTDWLVVSISYAIFIIVYSDISLKADPLTFLLNRKAYEFRLKKIDYSTAIFILDVNNFKFVNDTYGHHSGDIALQTIAKLIRKAYENDANCYRIGGDEFCVILKRGRLKRLADNTQNYDIYQALDNLIQKFEQLLQIEAEKNHLLKNGVSIGYGIFYASDSPMEDDVEGKYTSYSLKDVIKIADERMYAQKEEYAKRPNDLSAK